MARFILDVDNENWLKENWENVSDINEVMEIHTLDVSNEGQFYTELTDSGITMSLFKAVHLAVVERVAELEDEDGVFRLEEDEEFNIEKVLKQTLKHYNTLKES